MSIASRSLLRRWGVDVSPLRTSRDFRLLFSSGMVTYLGSTMTMVALPFQVAEQTGSYVAVGLIGLAELVPLVAFGLYGGALADSVDRRRIAVITELGALLLALVLLLNAALPSPSLLLLYVVAMLFAVVDGLQRPSLEAIVPRVVRHDQLAAAGILSSLKWNTGSILGPAVAGLLIAWIGVGSVYAVDAVTFALSLALLLRLRPVPPTADRTQRPSLRHIAEGLRYAAGRRDLLGTYAVDIAAMTFAFPYALFPFVAAEFDAPWSLGLLYAAGAVGGLLITATSGWVPRVHRHGRAIVLAAAVWGLAIAAVGLSPTIWFVLGFLVVAGAADMVSGQFRLLMWNQTIPDEMRGRLAGVELLSYSIGPLLGQVRASTVAQLTSLRMSLASGGVLCVVASGVLAACLPSLWKYDDRTDPNAVRERARRSALADGSAVETP
ncbi:MAG: MFS transporter [Candidatus Nanopelagicales bacterium]